MEIQDGGEIILVKLTKPDYKILEYLSHSPEASKKSICKSLKYSEEVVDAHLNYLYENMLIDEKTDLDFSSDFIYTKFLGVYSITDKGIRAMFDYQEEHKSYRLVLWESRIWKLLAILVSIAGVMVTMFLNNK